MKISKVVRILTTAPVMACAMLIILYILKPQIYGSMINFIYAILFLTILPLLAYPLQKYSVHFKDKGRDGQRSLAMIFAVCGYIAGCITNFFLKSPKEMWLIYSTYLFSGLCILALNKVFKIKASGHACGVAAPIMFLSYFGVNILLEGICIYSLMFASSLLMKRHTVIQLLIGTAVATFNVIGVSMIVM